MGYIVLLSWLDMHLACPDRVVCLSSAYIVFIIVVMQQFRTAHIRVRAVYEPYISTLLPAE